MPVATPTPAPAANLPKLLVVDDELGMREGMRRILTRYGFSVVTADNGQTALDLAAKEEFHLVLVDLKMPGLDGFAVMERLRELQPASVCIVVSAFATIESAVQSTKRGAFDFVVKPFAPDELLRVVIRASEQWQLEREAKRLRAEREAHLLELSAEKSRLRTILYSMGEGLLVVNIDGEVVLDNPGARRLLGRVTDAALPRVPVRELIDDETFLAEVERLHQPPADDAPTSGAVVELRRGDSFCRATLAPVRDADGAVLGVVVLLADISDAKALERTKTLFVSMVAHEVKAPLGAVEGYLRLMLDGDLDDDRERRHQVVQRCLQRTEALLALVQDLLEITRRDDGSLKKRLAPVDLEGLVRELLQFHGAAATARNVALDLEVAPGTPRPLGDRYDLERVVTNLLSNAIKYNREGGRVVVRVRAEGATAVLEVEDTGIGMNAEDQTQVGREFFRAKNAATRQITGTGLGLALTKRIVESHHGVLEVASEPGVGSTFRVLLPATPRERDDAAA
jgi:two-component system, OmpR family, phosphate regulon sensor histidine kinase PhoR